MRWYKGDAYSSCDLSDSQELRTTLPFHRMPWLQTFWRRLRKRCASSCCAGWLEFQHPAINGVGLRSLEITMTGPSRERCQMIIITIIITSTTTTIITTIIIMTDHHRRIEKKWGTFEDRPRPERCHIWQSALWWWPPDRAAAHLR